MSDETASRVDLIHSTLVRSIDGSSGSRFPGRCRWTEVSGLRPSRATGATFESYYGEELTGYS
ncbi:hypothetical protein EA472_04555 [Natrarchaeobius oligotrophus]|uniref:Uncharacterized protein n=1 Tax=Natrarchaeobius chitinivorans TaxID=1679083 RepID=A0A3N6NRD2_NATCH|nr:hypothetical protein EA472_04555 [Natrarchaeobius chitinivorans]